MKVALPDGLRQFFINRCKTDRSFFSTIQVSQFIEN
jgi:hypothetical protein